MDKEALRAEVRKQILHQVPSLIQLAGAEERLAGAERRIESEIRSDPENNKIYESLREKNKKLAIEQSLPDHLLIEIGEMCRDLKIPATIILTDELVDVQSIA